MNPQDVKRLADIWLDTSIVAHHFISETYWIENKKAMEEQYLPAAEVYIAENGNEVIGFVALVDNQIAALFVVRSNQGKGIGSLLLEYVKKTHSKLTLNVYQKNDKSVIFYKSKGFEILSEMIDQRTGEKEFVMQWKN